jgi:hypothetical protein
MNHAGARIDEGLPPAPLARPDAVVDLIVAADRATSPPAIGRRSHRTAMSTNGSRPVTVHQRDAWLPLAVAGLGLLLLLGLIQVPDVDGALSLAMVCVPLGIVPAAFVGAQYRLLAQRSPPEIGARRRNAFTAVVGVSGAADAMPGPWHAGGGRRRCSSCW